MMATLPRPYRADDALAAALDNQAEYWLYRAQVAGWEYGTADGLTWYHSGQPSAELNAVVRAHIPPQGDPAAAIAAARERVSPNGEPWTWWDPPAAIERLLPDAGLLLNSQDTGMAADLAHIPDLMNATSALIVERVGDPVRALLWRIIFRAANELPQDEPTTREQMLALLRSFAPAGYDEDEPLRLYLALLGGAPVAVSQLFRGAGVAGVYCVATLPALRRQGIGAAITRAALADARALGYHMAVLGASEMGIPVYRRLGFTVCGGMTEYVWGSSPPDPLSLRGEGVAEARPVSPLHDGVRPVRGEGGQSRA